MSEKDQSHDHHDIDVPTPFHWNGGKPAKPELLRYRTESLEWLEDALLSPKGGAGSSKPRSPAIKEEEEEEEEDVKPPMGRMSSLKDDELGESVSQ